LLIHRAATGGTGRHEAHRSIDLALVFAMTLFLSACPSARADSGIEISGSTGFGALTAGVTSGRFAISPGASLGVCGEQWFFAARDTVSFLGATGGRFGIQNETTLGGGLLWERVNVSAGLSLNEYSLPICGVRFCAQARSFAPGASARVDVFGPYLSGSLGISNDMIRNGAAVAAKLLPEVLAWDGTAAPPPSLISLCREFLVAVGMEHLLGIEGAGP